MLGRAGLKVLALFEWLESESSSVRRALGHATYANLILAPFAHMQKPVPRC